jgi:uncharacterized membrane protein
MSAKKKQSAAKKGTGSKQGMNANPVIVKEEKNRLFLPVVLIMAVIPLIVHLTIVHLDLNEGLSIRTDRFYRSIFSGKSLLAPDIECHSHNSLCG